MKIQLVGKFYDNHSLSIVNRNLLKSLEQDKSIEVSIFPLDSYDPVNKLDKKLIANLKAKTNNTVIADIQVRHTYPPLWEWPASIKTKVVYIQPWEYQKLPLEWQNKFETFADHVIVPSNFIRRTMLIAGMSPTRISAVHNSYDPTIYNQEPSTFDVSTLGVDKNKFNFIFVGNAQWRKNVSGLLNAWSNTFKAYDNARLIIKDNPAIYGTTNLRNELVKLQYKNNAAPIVYIDEQLSDYEMAALYKASKVLVHPYRAEGFGMHVQEALACGCLPIISANGPTDEFVPNDVGFRIAVEPIPANIADPELFILKPGDSTTLMGSHFLINEPNTISLQNSLAHVYFSHNTDFFEKAKTVNLVNTPDYIGKQYINLFKNIAKRKVKRNE